MFLLTFVLIIISMLSIYTQVKALEVSRFLAGQTSIATTLVNWHATAAGVAANALNPLSAGTAGCSLTPTTSTGIQCPVNTAAVTTDNVSHKAVATNTYTNLTTGISVSPPSGMGSSPFIWNSVAYTSGGNYYVLTYVTPPTSGTYVTTATSTPTQLNVTTGDIYRQLRVLGIPSYSFGYVSGNTLNVTPIYIGTSPTPTPVSYPLPTGFTIQSGTLGIISSPGQCTSC